MIQFAYAEEDSKRIQELLFICGGLQLFFIKPLTDIVTNYELVDQREEDIIQLVKLFYASRSLVTKEALLQFVEELLKFWGLPAEEGRKEEVLTLLLYIIIDTMIDAKVTTEEELRIH